MTIIFLFGGNETRFRASFICKDILTLFLNGGKRLITQETYERAAQEMLPVLYKMAMGLLRSDADARDAVQLSLLKAWEKRGAAREDAFRGYLARILINVCRDTQRARMRVFPAELPPLPAQESPDYRELYAALDALPETLRLPVYLKYLHDLSEKEAAQALGVPVSTFKNRLHRARRALRKALDREVTFE